GARFSTRSMIAQTRSTHGTERSRAFHTSANRPPGRSTRWNSSSARRASNQWKAWATAMPSNDPGANGHDSATADTTGTRGSEAAGKRGRPSTGSTATSSWSSTRASSNRVNLPVPAARSHTRAPGDRSSEWTIQSTASAGYDGRARSYGAGSAPEPAAATYWTLHD